MTGIEEQGKAHQPAGAAQPDAGAHMSSVDARGMVLDFSDIKRVVSEWIDQNLDHRMILHQDDPAVPSLRELGEPLYLLPANPTAENIARLIFDYAASRGFPVVEVRLWETPSCFATYQP